MAPRHAALALLLVAADAAPLATNVAAALGFGMVASLVFGLYPAWKAANERPVDALRKEAGRDGGLGPPIGRRTVR